MDRPPQSFINSVSTRMILFHQVVADKLGINPTDLKCILFLAEEPKSAGELARITGLTTGAVTAALDRLEHTGFVRRRADSRDRRKLSIELILYKMKDITPLFEPLAKAVAKLDAEYSDAEKQLIRQHDERLAAIIQAQTIQLKSADADIFSKKVEDGSQMKMLSKGKIKALQKPEV